MPFSCSVVLVSLVLVMLLISRPSFANHNITGEPPSFTTDGQPPEAVVVDLQAAGPNLVLPCGVTGIPTPSVSWFREGSLIDPTSVMADGRLSTRVTENEASRNGTSYYCVATNKIGLENSTVAALRSRNVNVSHSFFDGFQSTVERDVEIGTIVDGAVALECDFAASNPPPEVLWFADETTMLVEDTAGNTQLFLEGGRYLYIRALTAVQRMMRYHCAVNNSRDENGMPMRDPTTYTLAGNLTNEGVNVFSELTTAVGRVGEPVQLSYVAAARDAVNNRMVIAISCPPNDRLVRFTPAVTDAIITATLNDAARNMDQVDFTCQILGLNVNIMGTIIVSRPATITNPIPDAESLTDRERLVGSGPVQYPCDASGIPNTTITWYYNGVAIQSGSEVIVGGDGTLTIPAPQVNHSGIYQCVATNRFGEDRRVWILEVRKPTTSEIIVDITVPAEPPVVGEEFELQCQVLEIIPSSIDWFKDGEPLTSNDRITILRIMDGVSTLTIADVMLEDSGNYSCTATIDANTSPSSRPFTVEVQEPTTMLTMQPTDSGDNTAAIAGGTVVGVVAVTGGGVLIVVIVLKVKHKPSDEEDGGDPPKKKGSHYTDHPPPKGSVAPDPESRKAKEAATPGLMPPGAMEMEATAPLGSMYADPRSIEHETAGATGDVYALVAKPSPKKKQGKGSKETEATDGGADMYSIPDKSRKQKNQPLVYADVEVSNPRRKPPTPTAREQPNGNQDSVTYAQVAQC